jgi:hypothetical protein
MLGCGLADVSKDKAQHLAESLLNDIKSENYNNLDNYYTASFNESEPQQIKVEKYNKLLKAMGKIQSYELIEAKENKDSDNGGPSIALKYKVKCERLTVVETFIIINDEGHHKISFQNIENQ